MAVRRQCREKIYVELSKLWEHQYRNYARALRYAELAARYVEAKELDALNKRRDRLRTKMEKAEKESGRNNRNGLF